MWIIGIPPADDFLANAPSIALESDGFRQKPSMGVTVKLGYQGEVGIFIVWIANDDLKRWVDMCD